MSDRSAIEWTEATWNPVRGCTKVSPGCKNCYAETFAERWRGIPGHAYEHGFDVRLVPEALELPLRWQKPRRVFVNSMSDLFHEDVPDDFILAVFATIIATPQHTYQILTKRPERARRWFLTWNAPCAVRIPGKPDQPWPLPNVWLGTSVEDQAAADERIPHLLATPAAVRFLSCEPLLGPVDLRRWIPHRSDREMIAETTPSGKALSRCRACGRTSPGHEAQCRTLDMVDDFALDRPGRTRLGWVICGGESGPRARPCEVAWVRALVKQCRSAGVPAFVKQLGANIEDRNDAGWDGCEPDEWPEHLFGEDRIEHDSHDTGYQGAPVRVRTRDRKGGDPAEWPADLRVREMPEATR